MKKLFYFFAITLMVTGIASFFCVNSVYAEEPEPEPLNSIVQLSQQDFDDAAILIETLNNPDYTEFVLTQNITMPSPWVPLTYFDKIFNGNGYTISTNAPLFENVENGIIKNLGVIAVLDANNELIYSTSSSYVSSNFGLIAKNINNTTMEKCFVKSVSTKITVDESAYIGNLVGVANNSVIQNCYSFSNLTVTQNGSEAINTTIGGLVGYANLTSILFSYSVPYSLQAPYSGIIITANVTSTTANTDLVIGGFAGEIVGDKNSCNIINNFSGGTINYSYPLEDKTILVGSLFGKVQNYDNNTLNYCNTITNTANYNFIGENSCTEDILDTFSTCSYQVFTSLDGFITKLEAPIWNIGYEWNKDYSTNETNTIWCKVTNTNAIPYIDLQVFQFFKIETTPNFSEKGKGVELSVKNENGTDFETLTTSFKYGTKVQVCVNISDNFKPYKKVKDIKKVGDNANLTFTSIATDEKSAYKLITVTGASDGSYTGTSENISYTLKLIIVNDEEEVKTDIGIIKIGQAKALSEYSINYGDEKTFTASNLSPTYVFEKWYWLNGTDTQDATKGSGSNLASSVINLNFGATVIDETKTFITLPIGEEATPPIPYDSDYKIFTLVAKYTINFHNLKITSNISAPCCEITVSGVEQTTIVDYANMYEKEVAVGIPIEISIIVNEGYKFNYWSVGNDLAITTFIDTENNENASSTTIHLTLLSEDLVLVANFSELIEEKTDLTWLWWTLGGAGGLGLLTFLTIFIVRKRRRDSFITY